MALPSSASRFNPALTRLGWALAVCFILVTGILLTQTNRLRSEVATSQERVTALSRDLAAERRWSVILSSPALRTASFTLTPDADAGLRARAVMDPGTRRAVLAFQHFRAPEGHYYELWALHENTPVALGRIRPDATGQAVMRIEDVGDPNDLTAFTVSLEAEGGASASEPAGPIVMIGSIGG
jgi:anti-sigma-K factor RskA